MKASVRSLGTILAIILLLACGESVGALPRGDSSSGSRSATNATEETLVWSDGFNGTTARSAPNPRNWAYETGIGKWGNNELETYCAYGSAAGPCNLKKPNVYVAGGYLHIVARNPSPDVYTSARLVTKGLHSFQYGRIEARIKMPSGQGMWPAFWMLGDDIKTTPWPACGEIDIMEGIGSLPYTSGGSIHGTGFIGRSISTAYKLPHGRKFTAGFHTFGIIWSPDKIKFYVDNPANVYATYTPASLPKGAVWPFDAGKFFILLDLAVGGEWPGPPDAKTVFPQQMLVDYVRVYAEPGMSALASRQGGPASVARKTSVINHGQRP